MLGEEAGGGSRGAETCSADRAMSTGAAIPSLSACLRENPFVIFPLISQFYRILLSYLTKY